MTMRLFRPLVAVTRPRLFLPFIKQTPDKLLESEQTTKQLFSEDP